MTAPAPFSLADILDLTTRLSRFPVVRSGTGFSYPQRSWAYGGADAYYVSGREQAAIAAALDAALQRGKGATPWKRRELARLRSLLAAMVNLDGDAPGSYVETLFRSPLETIPWRGHALRLPLGLLFEIEGGRSVRLLAIERYLEFGRKGLAMMAVASLAAAEEKVGRLERFEIWHLRDTKISSYRTTDLRAWFDGLDRLLSEGEKRRAAPPAA